MTDQNVLVEKKDGYAVVTLNRPDAMNALNTPLRTELAAAARDLEADPDIRIMVLTGAGRAFCAGLDLKELGEGGLTVGSAVEDDPVVALNKFTGPIIGAINGVAITGGFELALGADILIASKNARFADTHGRVGVMPGWGLSQKLSRMIGISRAKELSLTGNFLSAEMAERWGLVNRVVPADELVANAEALAQDMTSMIPEMLTQYKALIDDGYGMAFADGMKLERTIGAKLNAEVTAASIEEKRKAVQARGKAQKKS